MSQVPPAGRRRLMAIGGAEDKLGAKRVLRRFVAEAGGRQARIVVCPTASALGDEIVTLYRDLFGRLGVADVLAVRPRARPEAQSPELAETVAGATGVFFTGGNQMKLSAIVRGTPFGDAVRDAYDRGVIIAGTSAGASVMSEQMIGYGASGHYPKHRIAGMAQGLGLLPGTIVDQHFSQRDRFGRLVALVAANPDLLGIGLDEDTAILVWDEQRFEVVGSGSAFCVDMRAATSDAFDLRGTAPFMVSGATIHFLPAGFTFDVVARRLCPTPAEPALIEQPSVTQTSVDHTLIGQTPMDQTPIDQASVGQYALVQSLPVRASSPANPAPLPADLAQLSRRVAAEGVDDKVVARNARRRRRAHETKEMP